MACEIASGLLHLHKHHFIHSDLALRNCLLSSEMTVKDRRLRPLSQQDDYFVTADQIWVPLRWIAPELIDEVHGNLLVVDQTKASNVWSLGVTVWELFELGNQPYRHYSDRQVLTYAVKEQQLKLPKPLLKVPLSERWYEVMQFCWLQPEQRPVAEEVHLLLSYLCAKGVSEAEEDFEQRWNSLRPSLGASSSHRAPAVELASSASSSFPLLEHFSTADGFHSEAGDDILTVTETSHGLNFEYKWEQARAEQPYCSSSTSGPLGQGNPHYQDIYYPLGSAVAGSQGDGLTLGVSPSYYESDHPGVVPVLSAHSPSVSSEYYIRIEEPVECNINLEDSTLDFSPGLEASSSSFSAGGGRCPAEAQTNSYWSAAEGSKASAYDSDSSPAVSLTMEPLQRRASSVSASPVDPHRSGQYSPNQRDRFHCEQSPPEGMDGHVAKDHSHSSEPRQGSWGSRSLRHMLGGPENQLGVSPSLSSPSLGRCDPYLEACQGGTAEKSLAHEGYYDMMGPIQKSMPRPHYISIDVEAGDGLLVGRGNADAEDDGDLFIERETTNWTSNHSANNNSLSFDGRQAGGFQDVYLDLHYTTPSPNVKSLWPTTTKDSSMFHTSSKPISYLEATGNRCSSINRPHTDSSGECRSYIHLCHEGGQEAASPVKFHMTLDNTQVTDPFSRSAEMNTARENIKENTTNLSVEDMKNPLPLPGERVASTGELLSAAIMIPGPGHPTSLTNYTEQHTGITPRGALSENERAIIWELDAHGVKLATAGSAVISVKKASESESVSECSRTADSGVEAGCSSISLVDLDECSDDNDITDITSGVFADSPVDYAEVGDAGLAHRPLRRRVGNRDSEDAINPASGDSPCAAFSPDAYRTSLQPKSLDSGYDTENNESPEFHASLLGGSVESDEPEMVLQLDLHEDLDGVVLTTSNSGDLQLTGLSERNPYRDSAYFSDYDAENDKSPCDGGSNFFSNPEDDDVIGYRAEREGLLRSAGKEGRSRENEREEGYRFTGLKDSRDSAAVHTKQLSPTRDGTEADPCTSPTSVPGLTMLSPFPPEMGGCLTKESSPDDGLGLESEHLGEEASSDCCCSSTVSEGSSTTQEPSAVEEQANGGAEDYSPAESLGSDSTIEDLEAEVVIKETEDTEDCADEEDNIELQKEGEDEEVEEEKTEEDSTLQAALNHELDGSLENMLPPLPDDLEVRAPLEDEEDSDDSESDEELRSYNIQEQSGDSDEEFPAVPVVVSDRSGACHLRSLLKMPTLLTQSFCDELERKKKAVSFFDDVTVFLFDQESPTGELADYSFPPGTEPNGQGPEGEHSHPQEGVNASDDSSDGNISEESGGFEWEDDFPLIPSPSSTEPASDSIATPPNSPAKSPEDKPTAQRSRFSVSRFSITHISDSDMDSVGGSSEDGDRE